MACLERNERTRVWCCVAIVMLVLLAWTPESRADEVVWTWMKGSSTRDNPGVCGTQGTSDSLNIPSTRYLSNSWIGPSGAMWLIGGRLWGGVMDPAHGHYDDIWRAVLTDFGEPSWVVY